MRKVWSNRKAETDYCWRDAVSCGIGRRACLTTTQLRATISHRKFPPRRLVRSSRRDRFPSVWCAFRPDWARGASPETRCIKRSSAFSPAFAAYAIGFYFHWVRLFRQRLPGSPVSDFQVAGGLIFAFCLAVRQIGLQRWSARSRRRRIRGQVSRSVCRSLLVGLAGCALLIWGSRQCRCPVPTLSSRCLVNLAIVAFRTLQRRAFHALDGQAASELRGVSQVIALLLAAIAISLIRRGGRRTSERLRTNIISVQPSRLRCRACALSR